MSEYVHPGCCAQCGNHSSNHGMVGHPFVTAPVEVPTDEGTHEAARRSRELGARDLAKAIRSCGITVQYAFSGEPELRDVISQLTKGRWFAAELQKARAEVIDWIESGSAIEGLSTYTMDQPQIILEWLAEYARERFAIRSTGSAQ